MWDSAGSNPDGFRNTIGETANETSCILDKRLRFLAERDESNVLTNSAVGKPFVRPLSCQCEGHFLELSYIGASVSNNGGVQ
jgi:hypothetical protein